MSRKILKRFVFLTIISAMLLSSACGLFDTGEPGVPGEQTEETQDAPSGITEPTIETLPLPDIRVLGDREIITAWSGIEGVEKTVLKQLVGEFNAESKHTFIQLASMSWPLLHQKMSAATAAGNGPDFVIQDYQQLRNYDDWRLLIDIGDIYRMDELYNDDELVISVKKNHYPENIIRELTLTADTGSARDVAVPMTYIPQRLFYRDDLFAAHGYETPPDTLEELFSIAASLAGEQNAIQYGLALSFEQLFGPLAINQLGRPAVDAGDREIHFLEDGFVQYLESIISLADNGLMPDESANYAELFRSGQLLMYIGDVYDVSGHEDAGISFELSSLPGGPGARKQMTKAYLFIPTFYINNRIEHFAEWVDFWNNSESQRVWSFKTGHPPVITDYSDFEEDSEWLGSQAPAFTRSLEAFSLDSNRLQPEYETIYNQYLRQNWLQALSGDLSVEETLEQVGEELEAYFEALRASEEDAEEAENDNSEAED